MIGHLTVILRHLLLVVVLATAGAGAQTERITTLPAFPADPRILGYVEIPNFTGLLANLEAMVQPLVHLAPGWSTQQIGGFLGDPGLVSLDASRPIVLIVLAPLPGTLKPQVTLWLPCTNPQVLLKTAATYRQAAEAVDTLVVSSLSQDPPRAKDLLPLYQAIAALPCRTDCRVRLIPKRLTTLYAAALTNAIATSASSPSQLHLVTPLLQKILQLEADIGLEVYGSIIDDQVDVHFDAHGIDVTAQVQTEAGSALSRMLLGSRSDPLAALRLLPESGGNPAMTMTCAYDPAACGALLDLLKALAKSPGMPAIDPQMTELITRFSTSCSGMFAVGIDGDEAGVMHMEGSTGITSKAAGESWQDAIMAMMAPGGCFDRINQFLGVGMSTRVELTHNVRSIDGLPVSRISYQLSVTSGGSARTQAESDRMLSMAKSFLHPTESVMTEQWWLFSQSPDALDQMVRQTLPLHGTSHPRTLHASTLGQGADCYVDYDYIRLLQLTIPMVSAQSAGSTAFPRAMADVIAKAPTGDPILSCFTSERGQAIMRLHVPASLFQVFVSMSNAVQRSGHAVAPAAPPPVDF